MYIIFEDATGDHQTAFAIISEGDERTGAEVFADMVASSQIPGDSVFVSIDLNDYVSPAPALDTVKDDIDAAMYQRINQGIRWAWGAQEPEYSILLNSGMREILSSWHQMITQTTPEENPHNGFIKSDGIIIRGPGDIDLPDAVIVEVANFSGLWVSKISQTAIAEKERVGSFTPVQRKSYDASAIDWSVRDETIAGIALTDWPVGKTDWTDDLCLYNP